MFEALWLSLQVALLALALAMPLAVGAGWLLARKRFPGRMLFQGILMLPLVMPPVTVGYLLLALFGRQGVLGRWLGLEIAFTFSAAVLAAAVVALPLAMRSARIAFEMVDPRLEQAAGVLGAGRWRAFFTITLPLAWPGLVGGFCLGFARALGEFGATVTFAGNIEGETRTLPLGIYSALQRAGGESAAWALVAVSIGISLAAFVASEFLARGARRHGAEAVA